MLHTDFSLSITLYYLYGHWWHWHKVRGVTQYCSGHIWTPKCFSLLSSFPRLELPRQGTEIGLRLAEILICPTHHIHLGVGWAEGALGSYLQALSSLIPLPCVCHALKAEEQYYGLLGNDLPQRDGLCWPLGDEPRKEVGWPEVHSVSMIETGYRQWWEKPSCDTVRIPGGNQVSRFWFLFYKHFLCLSVLQMEANTSLWQLRHKSPSEYVRAEEKAPFQNKHKREKKKEVHFYHRVWTILRGKKSHNRMLNGKYSSPSGAAVEAHKLRTLVGNAYILCKESYQYHLCKTC